MGSPFQAALEARDLDGLRVLAPFLELGVFWTPDLSGDELAQPIEVFVPLYRRAEAAGLRLKAHVGEWGTADDVWKAVELLELDEVQTGTGRADRGPSDPCAVRRWRPGDRRHR